MALEIIYALNGTRDLRTREATRFRSRNLASIYKPQCCVFRSVRMRNLFNALLAVRYAKREYLNSIPSSFSFAL